MISTGWGINLRSGEAEVEQDVIVGQIRWVTNTGDVHASAWPIAYEGSKVVVRPELMTVDEPYRITYRDQPAIAIKHSSGRVSFYRIPKG